MTATMTQINRSRVKFRPVSEWLPTTSGFWNGSRANQPVIDYRGPIRIRDLLTSDRVRRLFAVQCAIRTMDDSTSVEAWNAIDTAVSCADTGKLTDMMRANLNAAFDLAHKNSRVSHGIYAAAQTCAEDTGNSAYYSAQCSVLAANHDDLSEHEERENQSRLLTLFRPLDGWDDSWATETAVGLARTIYKEQRYDLLPMLSDALQDAGCDHPWLIQFLQDFRTPALGCPGWWFIDKLRGIYG